MWIQIDENKVRHYWECSECTNFANVQPDYYSKNGTPVCDKCDIDMAYIITEIDTVANN